MKNVMTEQLLERAADGIVRLTMNRPERRNALSSEMLDALVDALHRHAMDPGSRVVVLTGAGATFCAGGDVGGMSARHEMSFEERVEDMRQRHQAIQALLTFPKPLIARIKGAATGAGLCFALACDFRVAARSSRYGTAFARLAFSGDNGVTWLLSRIVGAAKARELLMLADLVGAEQALAFGMLTEVVDDDQLDESVDALASRLASGPTVALGYIKKNLEEVACLGFSDALMRETFHQVRCAQSADHKEAVAAFMEKRPVRFRGA